MAAADIVPALQGSYMEGVGQPAYGLTSVSTASLYAGGIEPVVADTSIPEDLRQPILCTARKADGTACGAFQTKHGDGFCQGHRRSKGL